MVLIAKKKFGGRYLDALRDVSRRLAHVELVPYHAPSFNAHRLINDLPSVDAAKRFAKETLIEAANRGEKTIIVTRQKDGWGLSAAARSLIVYEGGLRRGASLGPSTPGGRAILARYDIETPPIAAMPVSMTSKPGRALTGKLSPGSKIRILVPYNPKKPGTAAYAKFAAFRDGMTVLAYMATPDNGGTGEIR
jgi:hypothetical protein